MPDIEQIKRELREADAAVERTGKAASAREATWADVDAANKAAYSQGAWLAGDNSESLNALRRDHPELFPAESAETGGDDAK